MQEKTKTVDVGKKRAWGQREDQMLTVLPTEA